MDYVRLLPDTDLNIKFSATIIGRPSYCGRSRTRIAGMSRESYPELPAMPDPLVKIPAGLLASLIGKTIFSISDEESRFTLNGALMQFRENTIAMVATDGHRLALAEAQNPLGGEVNYKALLPRKAMAELLKMTQEVADKAAGIEFAGDDNHLFFRWVTAYSSAAS